MTPVLWQFLPPSCAPVVAANLTAEPHFLKYRFLFNFSLSFVFVFLSFLSSHNSSSLSLSSPLCLTPASSLAMSSVVLLAALLGTLVSAQPGTRIDSAQLDALVTFFNDVGACWVFFFFFCSLTPLQCAWLLRLQHSFLPAPTTRRSVSRPVPLQHSRSRHRNVRFILTAASAFCLDWPNVQFVAIFRLARRCQARCRRRLPRSVRSLFCSFFAWDVGKKT